MKILILIGPQASGKTRHVKHHYPNAKTVSNIQHRFWASQIENGDEIHVHFERRNIDILKDICMKPRIPRHRKGKDCDFIKPSLLIIESQTEDILDCLPSKVEVRVLTFEGPA